MELTAQRCLWFRNRGIVGIVKATDEKNEVFYFIGVGDGLNETIDVNLIISFGTRFPDDAGRLLFGDRAPAVAKRPAGAKRVSGVAAKGQAKKKPAARPAAKQVKKPTKKPVKKV
jgi:hypothetical protein